MYCTAALAATLYSGNVTGPDSRLSRPTLSGEPVALFSVPRAAARSGVAVAAGCESFLLADPELLSPEPHPASSAAAPRHAVQYVQVLIVLLMWWSRRRRRDSWSAGACAARAVRRPHLRARAVRG